jgi:hypothetical protein
LSTDVIVVRREAESGSTTVANIDVLDSGWVKGEHGRTVPGVSEDLARERLCRPAHRGTDEPPRQAEADLASDQPRLGAAGASCDYYCRDLNPGTITLLGQLTRGTNVADPADRSRPTTGQRVWPSALGTQGIHVLDYGVVELLAGSHDAEQQARTGSPR